MMIGALLLAWLLGALGVAFLWPRDLTLRADFAVIVSLGAIIGLFATSVLFFAASLLLEKPVWPATGIEIVAVAVLLWRVRLRCKSEPREAVRTRSWLDWVVAFVFVQVALVAAVVAWRSFQAEPLGGWDGWAIWNMHARFMLRAGSYWPELLGAPQLNWTHPDYPRLIPSSVARLWSWAGQEDPRGAALVSEVFAGATVALLVAALGRLRGRTISLVSGIVLLATPFFVTFAANEHADIPLGSFMLAALVLVALAGDAPDSSGAWGLAGICAGGAAWTKNEGLLFVAVFVVAVLVHLWRIKATCGAAKFLAALAIALIPVLYFKLRLAPPNDLVSAGAGSWLEKMGDPGRHDTILTSLWRDLGRFGEWQVVPWLVLALPFLAWRARCRLGAGAKIVPFAIGLMLVGYYAVYLWSPQDLVWHLDNSLVRLLLQLWPLTLLVWGLTVPMPTELASNSPIAGRWYLNRASFIGVNVVTALAVMGALSLQRGANELAVQRVRLAEVSVALGDGWFPLEKHGRDEWSWSSGTGRLLVTVNGGSERTVALRFAIGSVGARSVMIRTGARELWRGEIRDQRLPVTIAGLTLPPGTTTIEFTTDTAGVNETPTAGRRTLAFAIYNLRLE